MSGTAGKTSAAAALPVAVLALWMLFQQASLTEAVRFVGFGLVGVGLPGLVLWRLIGAYRRNWVEDCAAGFAIGTCAQVVFYLLSAPLGLQPWSWVWAPVVLVVAFSHPGVRARVWRRVEEPLRPLTAWLLAAATMLVLLVVYRKGPGQFVPAYTDPLKAYPDLAFQQALSASAKYDVPIGTLWLNGEPMHYHTFFHQSTAATAWATRIDLTTLIHGLTWLPLMLAGCGLLFALTQRFLPALGSTWGGPLAVLIAGLGGTLQVLPDLPLGGLSTAVAAYLSPTQNLGVMLALVLSVLVVDLLRGGVPRSRWVLLVLVGAVAAGAKSTVMPLAGCGFGLVFLVQLVTRRNVRTALLGGVLTVVLFLGALVALFGGESWGTEVSPGKTFIQLSPYPALHHGTGIDRAAQLLTAVATLLSWGLAAGGLLFLRKLWRDLGVIFLAGFSVAGLIAALMTSQSGLSQIYFLRTAFPAIAVLAAAGLVHLVDRLADRRAAALVVPVAGVLGLLGLALARVASDGIAGVKGPWLLALAALLLVGVLVTAAWKLSRRTGSLVTVFLAAVVSASMVGAVLVPVQALVSDHASSLTFARPGRGGATAPAAGAARWLRNNSEPGELVATNAHCIVKRGSICDSRHFWIAALTERPVLVEGWSYSNQANKLSIETGVNPSLLPYWDQQQLAANDAAFTKPSAETIGRLREYGVRWLFADRRAGNVSPAIGQYAELRHSTKDATVYEIR
ncbi:hypothetical protein [Kribbella sp. DT2]|uniref:hypothetical protein n=1 Tax=Kribbella sp. DT2 TaxID=3393427 RepID=UPI003CF616C2